MFKASDYSISKPAIATTVMVQKQELVSAQFGSPIFREYDHDGLLLDLFGTLDAHGYDVMEVSITGTRFSVLKLVERARLLEDMNMWCEREHEKELERATETADEDQWEFVREMQA